MLELTATSLQVRAASPMGYCDHFAFRKIAGDEGLSAQWVAALKASGGTLAVSWLNLGEYATVTDREQRLEAERMLDRILPSVFPLDVDMPRSGEILQRWGYPMKLLSLVAGLLLTMISVAWAFDQQQLVGEWAGEWNAPVQRGDLYVTIKKVDAERVDGTVYIRGPQRYHNRDLPFVGKLQGTRFTATAPTMPGEPEVGLAFEVNAEATQMRGTAVGRVQADAILTKKK